MKKILLAIGVMGSMVGLCANENTALAEQNFMMDFGVGFKNEHVSHGRNELHKVYTPRGKAGYQVFDGFWAYAGVDSVQGIVKPTEFASFDHISPFTGVSYDVTDEVKLDAKYKHHFYTAIPKEKNDGQPLKLKRYSKEVCLGIVFDSFIKLSLNGSYDFEREEVAIEGAAEYNFDLSFLLSGLGIGTWAKVGYDCTNKPMGLPKEIGLPKTCYYYYGAGADLAYKISHVRVKIGVGYEGNSAEKESWMNEWSGSRKCNLVLSTSIDCLF
ncbi:MAG: hypothetical protein LBF49_03480 [Puniceicoccales bacterium]|jgi:opacity protein-like surface antigen|nr:hypothetical protein [Puniceicoccales bacterium]